MDTSQLLLYQWALLALGGFMIGLAKTGIAGMGVLAVAIFANQLPARESTGAVLPLLILADLFAVAAYKRQAVWGHLLRLFPWAVAGIVVGWALMGHVDDRQVARLIGAILVGMILLHWLRKARAGAQERSDKPQDPAAPDCKPWFAPTMGILAGFTTMLANAAGPVMTLYLLAMRMPKMHFMGTAAWYFFILNSFKVPFSYHRGWISEASIVLDLKLAPFAIAGALLGKRILPRIDQRLFESLALGLALVAGVRLLF